MESVHQFTLNSPGLVDDILAQMIQENNDLLFRKKAYRVRRETFVYYDSNHRSYGAHSFILFRNAFDSYCNLQQEVVTACRDLHVDKSVGHYAIELFDKFFSCLIEKAIDTGLMQELPFSTELNSYFGHNIWNLTDLRMRFDSLYLLIENDHSFSKYGRIICIAICLFIASKQFENAHLQIVRLQQFLQQFGVPSQFLDRKVLLSLEEKVLNTIKFELKITPLKDYVETLLAALDNEVKSSCDEMVPIYFSEENISNIHTIALALIENYYMLQVPFLIKMFQVYQERQFNLYDLTEVEEIENLNRDKLRIASIILAAACILAKTHCDSTLILNLIATISKTEFEFIDLGYKAVLKFLFVGPNESHLGNNIFNSSN